MKRQLALVLAGAIGAVVGVRPALALPTMIRLGYSDCLTCHYAPQGGGPLNKYGKGIDEAQSLRAGEYRPRDSKLVQTLELARPHRPGSPAGATDAVGMGGPRAVR